MLFLFIRQKSSTRELHKGRKQKRHNKDIGIVKASSRTKKYRVFLRRCSTAAASSSPASYVGKAGTFPLGSTELAIFLISRWRSTRHTGRIFLVHIGWRRMILPVIPFFIILALFLQYVNVPLTIIIIIVVTTSLVYRNQLFCFLECTSSGTA